jgi:hypothetical protein
MAFWKRLFSKKKEITEAAKSDPKPDPDETES